MSEQDQTQATVLQRRPTDEDKEAWETYWKARGQPWRTEPEIAAERQKELAQCRATIPDIEKGIYPFTGMKLSRADVEWLLSTHESGGIQGPVDWNDESQRQREGLDLRGANLRRADLHSLPLTHLRGGLILDEWWKATQEQQARAAMLMEGANLFEAQLQNAQLGRVQLKEANLSGAQLEDAHLSQAWLEKADLIGAKLGGANLSGAHLEGACFIGVELCSEQHIGPRLADAQWGNANLSVVEWSQLSQLGDEWEAHQKRERNGKKKTEETRFDDYRAALRANRQLAVVLRNQGINEEADHFAYRAQLLQRKVFWHQHEFGRWLFSMLLALLSGYGYRIWRILAAYVVVVSLFALAYFVLGMHFSPHLHLDQAYLESITAFHGRVFLEQFGTNTPQIWLTALEAIVGLIIEGVFIAMLLQRFFGK